jgi:hypothetical protein
MQYRKNANSLFYQCFLINIHILRCLLYTKTVPIVPGYPGLYALELSHQNLIK